MSQLNVIVERVFDADKELVWKALTEKELMKLWYFDVKEFNTVVGFEFEFWAGEEGGKQWKHLCGITEVIPEKKLTYSWKYDGYSGMSHVTFELNEENNGTKLKLTHTGIDTFPSDIPELAIQNFEKGWNELIHVSLKEFLEK
ncbi:SRPBCC domain-containing protein [Arenibacter sp. F26102]|uniref:SRPBCC family protein n=1 Tax=Arenibacter sp. F26102 TaxID=2926416 RepID=UPI001FF15B53|nr:SRPBCC domain-containing protein [Arenibacter sp. F26102]MCK0148135.1 SRPBCC domain-containing protein [Arenibacter sp. F26102]